MAFPRLSRFFLCFQKICIRRAAVFRRKKESFLSKNAALCAPSAPAVPKKRRPLACLAVGIMALCAAALFLLMLLLNRSSPVYFVRQGSVSIDAPAAGSWPCPVTGQWLRYEGCHEPKELSGLAAAPVEDVRTIRVDGNATYAFTIQTDEPLYFNQVVSSVTLWINGREVRSETGEKLNRAQYGALARYSDGSGLFRVVVRLPAGTRRANGYWGLVLGTKQQILYQMNLQTLLDLSLVGMYVMMLIACVALYAQKTSERYLLLLALVTVLSLIRWLPQIRFAPLIHPDSGGLLRSDLSVFVRFFLFRQFMDGRVWKKLLPAAGVAAGLWLLSYCLGNVVWMGAFLCCYLLLEGAAIASGLLSRRSGNCVLAAGWAVNASIELFYLGLNLGLLPQGMVDICLRPMPHGRLLSLIAFFVATFGIFARKFRIADDLTERLDQRVQEQTAALTESNRQLAHAKAVKQNFMVDVAHDLRNPLFAMGGYLDLLNKAMPERTPPQERYLERMDKKLSDITKMVNDLLLMARLEDGRIAFHFTEFSLPELLENVAADGRAKARERGILIEVHAQSAPARMTGDSFRLREALDNLLSNAIRYSPDDGTIELRAAKEPDGMLSLSVQDHGAGIEEQALQTIFERYSACGERGENGLGLAISREIARKHSGDLRIESAPGVGTKATLWLPQTL